MRLRHSLRHVGRRWAAIGIGVACALSIQASLPILEPAQAAEPVKERQVVYGITPWTGKEYGGTFAPASADTIYLTASTRHMLDLLETDVYYWPITQEYMADWMGYRKELNGRLEIAQGDRVVATLDKVPYTFVYPEGYFGGKVELATGDAANEAFGRYQKTVDQYYKDVEAYTQAEAKWRAEMESILERVQKTGKPADPKTLPQAPQSPEPPKLLVIEPSEAFVVELAAGQYTLRVLDDKGDEIKGSRRKLVVFAPRRTGVGYQIIPESKWTMPVESGNPEQALYVSSEATFYLKAYQAAEYNRYAYARMGELSKPLAGTGQQGAHQWVMGSEVPEAKLQVLQDGKPVTEVEPRPYYVEQTPGYALGYRIVDFDASKPEMQGRQPSFVAYKVSLKLAPGARYALRLLDGKGEAIAASAREIRSVRSEPAWPLYAWPAVPLVAGIIVAGWRRRLRPRGTGAI